MHQVKSIKCTNCAAPLNLLGGGRVESITCSYCKSVLDLTDNYKVLTNFKNIKEQHKLPFEIGMRGQLNNIDYVIIGRVTYATVEYPSSEWTDFLLFSALYGYAYLTYEDEHLIYSRRNRTFPNLTWSELAQHSSIPVNGKAYTPFDQYEAKVVYVEGELTWIAKRDDKTHFIDLTNPPYGISAEKTNSEIEYYEAAYLDRTVIYNAFNIEAEEKAKTFHALEPFERPFLKSLSLISYWVLFIIALFVLAANIDGSGKIIKNTSADNQQVKHIDFTVKNSKYLVDLELQASSSKALNNFNLQIHKNKKMIFSLTPSSAYIFNDLTGSVEKKLHPWEKKSTKVRVSLNLEKLGTYQLSIKPIDQNRISVLSVTIKEASSRLNYFMWFFIFTLILWLLYKYFEWRYKLKIDDEQSIYTSNDSKHSKHSKHITQQHISFYITGFIIILIMIFGEGE